MNCYRSSALPCSSEHHWINCLPYRRPPQLSTNPTTSSFCSNNVGTLLPSRGRPGGGWGPRSRTSTSVPPQGSESDGASHLQRMPFSIRGTNVLIVFGVTTSAPVLIDKPAKPYRFDNTHCITGRNPCRYSC